MRKLDIKNSKGFTIIEVLIVLAIAGLILIVVLLAVPALQRNSRNTTMKNDASAIAGGINEYSSNNNGSLPNTVSGTGTITIDGSGTDTSATVQGTTQVSTAPANTNPSTAGAPPAGTIVVYKGFTCTGGPSTRAVAVVYSTENSSNNPQKQCLDT